MPMRAGARTLEDSLSRIRAWGEARDWRGYDPYDGLASPAAAVLSLGTPLGRRLLTQAVKLSPVNLRPVLGIRPAWNAKALALVASGYTRLFAAGEAQAAAAADRWLDWLAEDGEHGGDGLAWGYHFDVQTRFFRYPRGTPNTIATSFAAQALLDGYELLEDERWGEPARRAAVYLREIMLVRGRGSYFRYLPGSDELVHNANLLAAAVLARAARLLDEDALAGPAAEAVATTLTAQRSDGSWPYAETPAGGWVDNFHTAYVLESLAECEAIVPEARPRLELGLDYWEDKLFRADGTPKYSPDRALPLDAHCFASAIETWLAVSGWRDGALARAERTAQLLVERMLDPSGFVHFQRRRLWTIKVPFVRWTTAPAFRALARLVHAQRSREHAGVRGDAHARLA